MKQRLLTAGLMLLILVGVFTARALSLFVFDVFVVALCVIAGYESSKLFSKMGLYNNNFVVMLYPSLAYLVFMLTYKLSVLYVVAFQILLLIFLFVVAFLLSIVLKNNSENEIKTRNLKVSKNKFAFNKALHSVFSMVYPSLLILILVPINHFSKLFTSVNVDALYTISTFALILAFALPILTDTFAMLVGYLFKGKKLCPKISPKKTVSGAVGGVVLTVLVTACLFMVLNATVTFSSAFSAIGLELWHILILATASSVVCQIGDIFESLLKRKADVKDSGKILPGHGGVLDRFDSHAFNEILILLFFIILI